MTVNCMSQDTMTHIINLIQTFKLILFQWKFDENIYSLFVDDNKICLKDRLVW